MKAKKSFLVLVLISISPLVMLSVIQWYRKEFSHIPEKRMVFDGRDINEHGLVRWPKKGVATIICPKFLISFEGMSWSDSTLIRATYQVDGRYGGINPPDSEPAKEEMGNGVKYEYSSRMREVTIICKNHRFIYCDYLNTLKAGGKEYSTAQAPVYLWVSEQGTIKQMR